MSRKSEFSKKKKISICRAYDDGKGSFLSLAKSIGVNKETIRRWYYRYKKMVKKHLKFLIRIRHTLKNLKIW